MTGDPGSGSGTVARTQSGSYTNLYMMTLCQLLTTMVRLTARPLTGTGIYLWHRESKTLVFPGFNIHTP